MRKGAPLVKLSWAESTEGPLNGPLNRVLWQGVWGRCGSDNEIYTGLEGNVSAFHSQDHPEGPPVIMPAPSYSVLGPCSLGFRGIMGLRKKLSQHYFEHHQQTNAKCPEFTSQLSDVGSCPGAQFLGCLKPTRSPKPLELSGTQSSPHTGGLVSRASHVGGWDGSPRLPIPST
ncbi:hypothetical protein SKAU_G00383980 [Synaphobranchus kaupii]|uniref:Uncharacterized protein n=1 Tax=Synaphobranchus kaupii TaxID=118154 RepID=A0A9Q1EE81_SYNKA|nr:hypothetical protein SKAU_G00383980 [Synaphobranchus kaupii]